MQFTLPSIIAVALGGALGAVTRFYVSVVMNKNFPNDVPLATLSVNIVGSFLIGILVALFLYYTPNEQIRLFLITGFLGALTTYSTFAIETFTLFNTSFILGTINILLNVLGTILAAAGGYKLVLLVLK
jgi:CrcB protein